MNPWALATAGLVVAVYAAVSRRLSTTPFSGPLVFVAGGLAVGPLGLHLTDLAADPETVRGLLEIALSLVLFTDAAAIRSRQLRVECFLTLRLLTIGLPLTIAAGWLLAWPMLPGLTVWECALVGIILAPTDAALGQQAVADRRVPALVRHGLSVESGLNDGLVLPFFLLALAAAGGSHGEQHGPLETFLRALLLSGAIGCTAGYLSARVLRSSTARGWNTRGWRQLLTIAVPAIAYPLSAEAQGSGFIAVWVAGLTFGAFLPIEPPGQEAPVSSGTEVSPVTEFAERLGLLLSLLSFFVFGAVILGPALQDLTWQILVYAVLSLTAARMLPVAVALVGTGLSPVTVTYVGWFGPRGLASLVFGLIVYAEHFPKVDLLTHVVALTVGMSVLVHGASAAFLGSRYGAWYATRRDAGAELREQMSVPEGSIAVPRGGQDFS
ncbi:cation:proton antiporter [Kitasatospora sp. NPDC101157]|uniref:cation:proton antiporter n=1 Tax=Kitasatospora sp. NPDC101157 TaxID=3364098 RepID=UPI0038053060